MEAIEVFKKFKNKRAEGICYQNLGCLTAKLNKADFTSAFTYI
jgi:hypothetical protein